MNYKLLIDTLITIDEDGMPQPPTTRQMIDKDVRSLYNRDKTKDKSQYIAECIVIGVKKDSDNQIEVNAKILPNIDEFKKHLNKDDINKTEIENEIKNIVTETNKKLPNYKHIKNYKILEEPLEKTTTQKIKRFGNNLSI